MNVPNILTFSRIFLIPIFLILFYLPFKGNHLAATIVFIFAAFTDWLDGYLARTLKQTSKFGEFLDPVADKLMVIITLTVIVAEKNIPYIVIPALIIISREVIVSALREWMAELGKRAHVSVSMLGKVKTSVQMLALTSLLLANPQNLGLMALIGYILLCIAAILTLWSMVIYLKAARNVGLLT